VHDDSASAEDPAALHAAVLRSHDQLVRMEPKPRSLRVARRLNRLHLSWLLIPWYLVVAARLFLPAFRGGFPAGEQQAARLYRRLSGKDPHVTRAEVSRTGMQLGVLDERLRDLDQERPGAPRGADPGEVDAAAGALLGYYLAGRRTDDELLAQVEAAWGGYEELFEQQVERAGVAVPVIRVWAVERVQVELVGDVEDEPGEMLLGSQSRRSGAAGRAGRALRAGSCKPWRSLYIRYLPLPSSTNSGACGRLTTSVIATQPPSRGNQPPPAACLRYGCSDCPSRGPGRSGGRMAGS
jgi:hypothetical protein